MMKILTLTTQYANNYGALLQCYALRKYLSTFPDCECEVINYFHAYAKENWQLWKKPNGFRDIVKNIYCFANVRLLFSQIKKNRLMLQFVKDYIPRTQNCYDTPESIRTNPPLADVYICGSDQIWNMTGRKIPGKTVFFLDFVPAGARRISYAASIADPWSKDDILMIEEHIKKFDAVSIREKGNLSQVQTLYPSATIVIDPVFLLNKEMWDNLKNTEKCIEEPYILCYFLSVTEQMVKTVKKLKELTGYKVVHLNLNALDKFNSDVNIRVADPRDFIGLISKASVVCTNSFHCSAFSVIYKRDFVFCPKHHANERIENLQEVFGLGNVMMTPEKLETLTAEQIHVDYSKADVLGGKFIDYSKEFLRKAIYGDGN